ncbi:MAG: outer membrane beta-barrel protein [Verrucomicrobia bacterium]|nr:outer membrane beta-barrel protein [Verrucomicrobiota bacterium]
MKSRQQRRGSWWVWAGVLTQAAQLRAFEANDVLTYSLGPLLLRPQLQISERYDSNIYYRQRDVIGDFRTDILPGLNLALGKPDRFMLSLSYQLDKSLYLDQNRLDSLGHMLNAQVTYQGAKLWVQGSDRLQFFENQVLSQELNFENLRKGLVGYTTQSDTYRVGYRFTDKTALYLDGSHESFDYSKDTFVLDYDSVTGTIGLQKAVLTKTTLFSEVYYGQTATAPNTPLLRKSPHSEFIGGFVGVNGNFTEKLEGQLKAGFESRSFADGGQGASGPVVGSSLTYRASEKRSVSLQYNRRSNVSVQNGTVPYVMDAVSVQFQQGIGTQGKWIAHASGGYGLYSYLGKEFASRTDSLYSLATSLDYFFQPWMKAGIGYDFYKYESRSGTGANFGVSNYDAHRFSLRLTVGY